MFYNYEVNYSDLEGKIYPIKNKGAEYIALEISRIYIPEKKYTKVDRKVIGKPIADKPGFMNPNGNFEQYFPDAIPKDQDSTKRCKALTVGEHILINKTVENLELDKHLENAGFDKETSNFILDFASYQIIEQSNVAQYFEQYEAKHALFAKDMHIISDSTVSRKFEDDIPQENILDFFDSWNKDRDKTERVWCSYDSTNMNCQAGDIEFADYGWAKDDPSKPVIEYSVVYDTTNHIPLLYEFYPGDITDTAQLEIVIDKVHDYGYNNIGFILDRGYFSKSNLEAMDKYKMAYIIMMKAHKKLVRSIIDDNRGTFENMYESKMKYYEPIYGKHVKAKLDASDKTERNIYIYFNAARQLAESSNFVAAIEDMELHLQKIIAHPEYKDRYKVGELYKKFFDLVYDKDDPKLLLSYTPKHDVINKEVSYMGYFCIIHNDPNEEKLLTPAEVYKLYKSRDVSEKVFNGKTFIGDDALRAYSLSRVTAKKFVAFIASIIRNDIHYHLFDSLKCLGKKRNYMQVPSALKELSMIIINEGQAGNYSLDHAINKKEKDIFEAFDMTEDDVYTSIAKITERLSKQFVHCKRTKAAK